MLKLKLIFIFIFEEKKLELAAPQLCLLEKIIIIIVSQFCSAVFNIDVTFDITIEIE